MMTKAKDLMTKNVTTVKKGTPILDALKLMTEKNITGIPVVDDDATLEGILTERDVLRLLYASGDKKWKVVEDFMTQPAIYFDEDEDLDDVCDCLMNNYIRRVPVMSKGKMVGIISRKDIIGHILRSMYQADKAQ